MISSVPRSSLTNATPHEDAPLDLDQRSPSAMQGSVLVLNRGFSAVHVISVQRAFCLLCKGVAEVIAVEDAGVMAYDFEGWKDLSQLKRSLDLPREHEEWIRSVHFDIEVPRIIRLLKYERGPRNAVKYNRRNIFLRDEHRCQYCNRRFASQRLSLDHVMPRSRGGPDTWENVVCACLTCNTRKGGRTPAEAGMRLIREPVKPKRSPLLSRQLTMRRYACWKTFIPALEDTQQ